jgi:FtsP/CotA-like multicopper oxidase with cupredoxin domain
MDVQWDCTWTYIKIHRRRQCYHTLFLIKHLCHTLHLHGDHNADADGVFETILPNQTYNYNFIAGPAGAFPYHCHAMPAAQQMRMGMLMIL